MFHIKKVWRGKSLHPFESIEINLNSKINIPYGPISIRLNLTNY